MTFYLDCRKYVLHMHTYFLRKNCSVNDIDEGRRFLPAFLLASGLKVTRPSSTDLRLPSLSSSFELRCQKLRNLNLDLEDGLAGEVFESVVTGDGDVMEEAPDDDVVDELPAIPPELAVVTGILNKFKNHLLSLLSLKVFIIQTRCLSLHLSKILKINA